MTVAQLKALLAAVPDDAVICTHHQYSSYKDAKVSIRTVVQHRLDATYSIDTESGKQAVIFT